MGTHNDLTFKQKMRSVFFAAIDNVIGEMKERFSEKGMKVFKQGLYSTLALDRLVELY